jgi:hypothetical protein
MQNENTNTAVQDYTQVRRWCQQKHANWCYEMFRPPRYRSMKTHEILTPVRGCCKSFARFEFLFFWPRRSFSPILHACER